MRRREFRTGAGRLSEFSARTRNARGDRRCKHIRRRARRRRNRRRRGRCWWRSDRLWSAILILRGGWGLRDRRWVRGAADRRGGGRRRQKRRGRDCAWSATGEGVRGLRWRGASGCRRRRRGGLRFLVG